MGEEPKVLLTLLDLRKRAHENLRLIEQALYEIQQRSLDHLPDKILTLKEFRQLYVKKVVAAMNGDKTRAARMLGCDRKTVYVILKERQLGNK